MILTNELKGKMVAKGFTQENLAKNLGISARTMNLKLKRGVFNSNEIEEMIKILDIEDPVAIFFAP